jgi:colanic acid/amylovoran biosynthesis glycosyltransferase
MKIAYLVNQYPKVSHSFIRREIAALEALGMTIARYTLRRTREPLADSEDERELALTSAVIAGPAYLRISEALATALSGPARFFRALALAIGIGWNSDRSVLLHLAYLIEAAVVAAWCKRDEAAHIHAHFGTNSATVAMLASALSGLPWSFTAHGPEEFDRPLGIGLGRKIESAKFAIAISSFGRSQLWRWADHPRWHKIKVVHCGLDASFLMETAKPMPQRPRLVCVGRLCEQKGQLLLVEAAGLLKARGVDCEIVLAGDGPLRNEIEAAILAAGLEDRISITGWISGERVRDEIWNARALVLPSFAEGLPVVIMEAMALERPVISTSVAGIPELVVHGETGWLAPAGDAIALAKAMSEALSLETRALADMGRRGKARVLERHDAMVEAGKLKALFEGQGL